MAKGKQGFERGAGPYSKVNDGKDRIVQGDKRPRVPCFLGA